MKSKNLGAVLILFGLVIGAIFLGLIGRLNTSNSNHECYQAAGCAQVGAQFSISHIAVGVVAFLFALGVYMALFSNSDTAIMNRLKEKKNKELEEEKFEFAMDFLNENERKILKLIMEHDGIKQDLIAIKTKLSSAQVSKILSIFEKKGIITKEKSENTYYVHLKKG